MVEDKSRLMRIRRIQNKKRPSFRRYESWRYKKLSKSGWRKQRGIDNKTRRKTKTGVKSPEPGYRNPKAIRGLHPSGYKDINVIHTKDIDELDPKIHAVRINSRLGARKRIALIEYAQEKGFRILNLGISKEELMEIEGIDEEELEENEDLDEEDSEEDQKEDEEE
ncbi:50S ribosomal protein L32e [Candidatus Harpocratesius sp.]